MSYLLWSPVVKCHEVGAINSTAMAAPTFLQPITGVFLVHPRMTET